MGDLSSLLKQIKPFVIGWLYSSGTWSPTPGGFSVNPTGVIARYTLVGKTCTCFVAMPNAGTSNATTFTLTAPFTAASITNMYWYGSAICHDNTSTVSFGFVNIGAGTNSIGVFRDAAGAAWTASGGKRAQFTLVYEIA